MTALVNSADSAGVTPAEIAARLTDAQRRVLDEIASASDTSEAERAASVAWLHKEAVLADARGICAMEASDDTRAVRQFALRLCYMEAADAIARLAHHEPKS